MVKYLPNYHNTSEFCVTIPNYYNDHKRLILLTAISQGQSGWIANSADPDQTALLSSLIWVGTACSGSVVPRFRLIMVIEKKKKKILEW